MITTSNLEKVLEILKFEVADNKTAGKIYKKSFEQSGDIVVDFHNKSITYPERINTGFNTTTNFGQDENFVVLECVNRLLEKGYKPEHIFLEKVWTLGHTGKGGRADITVLDNDGKDYLIIECKRAGKDYKDAKKELFEDPEGKQLFSYWAQARSVRWLQLYASDYDEETNSIVYQEEIIRSSDDENIVLLANEDDSVQLFSSASTAQDAFMVWDETYSKKSYQNIIFGEDSLAYKIGNAPIKQKDLKKFNKQDGLIDSFREILRHNGISDKENAFNKVLSLFICKFVDEESHKNPADIMDFQYIDGKDNYYSLYERLFSLFKDGMLEYLKDDIWYLKNDYIAKTLNHYTGKSRKELEKELTDTFQKTKVLSSQVFAFIEVYNEKDFLQNGKILVEIVELFQNYKLAYTSKDQFLGELFENLLNQGFKQEAGQFFTPVPITRFVWNSLPLDRFLNGEKVTIPKVIDFACGSGHFLTEGIAAISDLTYREFDDNEISKSFYGIDNDKRLAKVSKIAMLLNGAGSSHILAGDGLELNEEFLGESNSFDILVANPPYSVDDFKAHSSRRVQKMYETIKLMSFKCGDIQNVFIERMHHLLKPNGLAAIVMPSSLLTDTNAATIKTREILLQNFYLHSITCFEGKTFGKTSTPTIILFLEHFDFPPQKAKLTLDCVNAILSGEPLSDWNDLDVFTEYLRKIDVDKKDYIAFAKEEETIFDNTFCSYFIAYAKDFKSSNSPAFTKIEETIEKEGNGTTLKKNEKSSSELKTKLNSEFYSAVKKVEREKILNFALTYKQQTLIIKAPTDNDEQKKFLGYTNSERRHKEGLKETEGLLTNLTDRNAKDKLAFFVQSQFNNIQCHNPQLDKYVQYVRTTDLLDFSKVDFDLVIKTTLDKQIEISNKYPTKSLEEILVQVVGKTTKIPKEDIQKVGSIPVITQESGNLISGYTDNVEPIKDLPLIVFGDHSCTFKYVDFEFVRGADGTQLIKVSEEYVLKYIYEYLCSTVIDNSGKYERHFKYLKETQIPLPPREIQYQIVSECEKVDEEYTTSKVTIEDLQIKINDLYKYVDSKSITTIKLSDKSIFDISIGRRILNSEVNPKYDIPVYSANVFEPFGMINKLLIKDFSKDSVVWGIDGDWMVNVIKANNPFYPTDHCGVLRIKTDKILPKYMAHLLEIEGNNVGFKRSYRASIDRIESLSVKIAPIEEQLKAIPQIEQYEAQIAEAKAIMSGCADRKKKILEKYLN